MLYKFSKSNHNCSNDKDSHLQYHAMYAREEDFNTINDDITHPPPGSPMITNYHNRLLRLDVTESVGTTKYIAILPNIIVQKYIFATKLTIKMAGISFPYMM